MIDGIRSKPFTDRLKRHLEICVVGRGRILASVDRPGGRLGTPRAAARPPGTVTGKTMAGRKTRGDIKKAGEQARDGPERLGRAVYLHGGLQVTLSAPRPGFQIYVCIYIYIYMYI